MGLIETADERPAATLRRVHGRNVYQLRCDGGVSGTPIKYKQSCQVSRCARETHTYQPDHTLTVSHTTPRISHAENPKTSKYVFPPVT